MITVTTMDLVVLHLVAKLDGLLYMADWQDEVLNYKPIVYLGVSANIKTNVNVIPGELMLITAMM